MKAFKICVEVIELKGAENLRVIDTDNLNPFVEIYWSYGSGPWKSEKKI